MNYMGSKRRFAKFFLPVILEGRTESQVYVEPFMGGCNSLELVSGPRIAADISRPLVALFQALQNGWEPPSLINESHYLYVKSHQSEFPDHYLGFVGFSCTANRRWFGSYAKGFPERNYADEARRHLLRQIQLLKDVEFRCCDYRELDIPHGSIVYCDPPYQGLDQRYHHKDFNYDVFWNWVREQSTMHRVFVSGVTAPVDFYPVWEGQSRSQGGENRTSSMTEKVFQFHER